MSYTELQNQMADISINLWFSHSYAVLVISPILCGLIASLKHHDGAFWFSNGFVTALIFGTVGYVFSKGNEPYLGILLSHAPLIPLAVIASKPLAPPQKNIHTSNKN